MPADIAVFDGYVELKDGQELVGLSQDPDEPRTFRAVTWFERACLDWDVLPDDAAPRHGAIRVELSAHCVERYRERIVRGGTVAGGAGGACGHRAGRAAAAGGADVVRGARPRRAFPPTG